MLETLVHLKCNIEMFEMLFLTIDHCLPYHILVSSNDNGFAFGYVNN